MIDFLIQQLELRNGIEMNRPYLLIQLMSKQVFKLNSMIGSSFLLIYVPKCEQDILVWVGGWNIC